MVAEMESETESVLVAKMVMAQDKEQETELVIDKRIIEQEEEHVVEVVRKFFNKVTSKQILVDDQEVEEISNEAKDEQDNEETDEHDTEDNNEEDDDDITPQDFYINIAPKTRINEEIITKLTINQFKKTVFYYDGFIPDNKNTTIYVSFDKLNNLNKTNGLTQASEINGHISTGVQNARSTAAKIRTKLKIAIEEKVLTEITSIPENFINSELLTKGVEFTIKCNGLINQANYEKIISIMNEVVDNVEYTFKSEMNVKKHFIKIPECSLKRSYLMDNFNKLEWIMKPVSPPLIYRLDKQGDPNTNEVGAGIAIFITTEKDFIIPDQLEFKWTGGNKKFTSIAKIIKPIWNNKPNVNVKESQNLNIKRKMCKHFQNGKCSYADKCNFAHNLDEIKKTTNNLPKEVHKSIICNFFKNGK